MNTERLIFQNEVWERSHRIYRARPIGNNTPMAFVKAVEQTSRPIEE
jgi:hypothetical protein